MSFPDSRMRRLRRTSSIRELTALPNPPASHFVWPIFIINGEKKKEAIKSMPGQYRLSLDLLEEEVGKVHDQGVNSVLLFGITEEHQKNECGTYAYQEDGLIQKAIILLKRTFPELIVMTDVCLCEYTDHGHCGPRSNGTVNNDATISLLGKIAVSYANVGADVVAPSSMMDGQIYAIRKALAENKFDDTILMSYSTKFASAMYGPFRDAAGSTPGEGDRKSYQMSWKNQNEAILESLEDEKEGADILMVKPSLFYLDIISKIKERSLLPLAAYNVSGEYSMLHASAQMGYGDLDEMVRESIGSLWRTGVDIIISYWANDYKRYWG